MISNSWIGPYRFLSRKIIHVMSNTAARGCCCQSHCKSGEDKGATNAAGSHIARLISYTSTAAAATVFLGYSISMNNKLPRLPISPPGSPCKLMVQHKGGAQLAQVDETPNLLQGVWCCHTTRLSLTLLLCGCRVLVCVQKQESIPWPHKREACEVCLCRGPPHGLKTRPNTAKKRFASLRFCVSSLHRDHALRSLRSKAGYNLLCIVKQSSLRCKAIFSAL